MHSVNVQVAIVTEQGEQHLATRSWRGVSYTRTCRTWLGRSRLVRLAPLLPCANGLKADVTGKGWNGKTLTRTHAPLGNIPDVSQV